MRYMQDDSAAMHVPSRRARATSYLQRQAGRWSPLLQHAKDRFSVPQRGRVVELWQRGRRHWRAHDVYSSTRDLGI